MRSFRCRRRSSGSSSSTTTTTTTKIDAGSNKDAGKFRGQRGLLGSKASPDLLTGGLPMQGDFTAYSRTSVCCLVSAACNHENIFNDEGRHAGDIDSLGDWVGRPASQRAVPEPCEVWSSEAITGQDPWTEGVMMAALHGMQAATYSVGGLVMSTWRRLLPDPGSRRRAGPWWSMMHVETASESCVVRVTLGKTRRCSSGLDSLDRESTQKTSRVACPIEAKRFLQRFRWFQSGLRSFDAPFTSLLRSNQLWRSRVLGPKSPHAVMPAT
jgi:hypothetical protein